MTAPLTPEEREKRLADLRDYHAGIRPHYEDEDSRECGCGQCDAHLLLTELDRVKANATHVLAVTNAQAKDLGRLYSEIEKVKAMQAEVLDLRREVDKWIGAAEDAGAEANGLAVQLDAALAEVKRTVAMHAVLLESARLEGAKAAQGELADALAEAKALRGIIETTAIALELEDFTAFAARLRSALADHPERPQVVRCFLCNWQGLPEDVERDHSAECKAHPEPKR